MPLIINSILVPHLTTTFNKGRFQTFARIHSNEEEDQLQGSTQVGPTVLNGGEAFLSWKLRSCEMSSSHDKIRNQGKRWVEINEKFLRTLLHSGTIDTNEFTEKSGKWQEWLEMYLQIIS